MLRAKRIMTFSSVQSGGNKPVVNKTIRQHGSILIGLIITMVVMASLAAGMVYVTTTSTFQELLANNNARAYYAAESGGRYASSLARSALSHGIPLLSSLTSSYAGETGTTYTMANGSTIQIKNWQQLGSTSLYFSFDAVGTVGSGFLRAKRMLSYKVYPADQGGAPGGEKPPIPPEVSDFNISKIPGLDKYFNPYASSEEDIKSNPWVDSDPALNLKSSFFTVGLSWWTNSDMAPLDRIRNNNADLLSYGVQVKVSIDTKNKTSDYNFVGISFRLDDTSDNHFYYDNMYGISFFKIKKVGGANTPDWYSTVTPNSANLLATESHWLGISYADPASSNGEWYVILWKRAGPSGSSRYPRADRNWRLDADQTKTMPHTLLAYQKLILNTDPVLWIDPVSGWIVPRPWSTIQVYVKEKSNGTNEISGYLASPESYPRRTGLTPTDPILWAESNGAPNSTVPSTFRPINWTVVNGSGATAGSSANIVVDSSFTTLNYPYTTDPRAREIGLHIYYDSTSAQNVFYDNFYIDLSPSGGWGGYVDGSGVVIQYP